MIFGLRDNKVIMTLPDFSEAEEAKANLPSYIEVVEGPDWAEVGWTFEDGNFIPDVREGMVYDEETHQHMPYKRYREALHTRTTDDTMEALRKIREGDTSLDWSAWLSALDAYNREVSATAGQEVPMWPTYPTRPVKE